MRMSAEQLKPNTRITLNGDFVIDIHAIENGEVKYLTSFSCEIQNLPIDKFLEIIKGSPCIIHHPITPTM